MEKNEELKVFNEEMEKILDEKFEKYQDKWKTSSLGVLKNDLYKQVLDLMDIIHKHYLLSQNINDTKDKEELKRILTHIANICFFIFTKINN